MNEEPSDPLDGCPESRDPAGVSEAEPPDIQDDTKVAAAERLRDEAEHDPGRVPPERDRA